MMEKTICATCGCQNNGNAYFCCKCGRFLFENADPAGNTQLKLRRIAANLKENPHIDILWNDTVDAYTRKVERIQSLLRVSDLGINSDELNKKVSSFLDMCRKPDFEIAFAGAVKAGKSTLINALLGRDYASTDPNPETAVLTKFRSSEQDFVRVKFYSKTEWEQLWRSVQKDAEKFLRLYKELDADKQKAQWVGREELYRELSNSEIEAELKKWSSSQSASHFFVKEIEVGISTLPKDFPKQVVFVDTPGLFDPVAFRSQISIDYIRSANAVLVCIKAGDLHGEEVKTLESVFSFSGHKREKVFIVATNWDKLNNVVLDWEKRHGYMVENFTGKAFYPDRELAEKNIIYADSYHYNLCRDYNSLGRGGKRELNILLMKIQAGVEDAREQRKAIPEKLEALMDAEVGLLSPSDLEKLMVVTNVQAVNKVIADELVSQYSQLLFSDIRIRYDDVMHMTARIAGERKKTVDERITISNADLREIEEKIEQTKKNRNEIQQCQKQLAVALGSVNKSTQKRLDGILSKLEKSDSRTAP